MTNPSNTRRAADQMVDLLVGQGATHIYGVPGESYLAVLDALHGREGEISFVTCRQEGGAAMAAEAHGKLTGRPGIAMVTRGPGATNASAGVHIAYQDSTPMILFIGQVARSMIEREAFQEIDYRRMFGQMAKWVAQIDDPARMQEYILRAYHVAMSGRPGPVVLALPEDMLVEPAPVPPVPRRVEALVMPPAPAALSDLRTRLAAAERPLIIVGGAGWTASGIAALAQFAKVQGVPVAASFRCQGLMNNEHPNYVGHFNVAPCPYLNEALAETDLLIAIGPRLGEMTTQGYSLLSAPVPAQTLAHIYPSGEEIGRVYEAAVPIVADVSSFCEAVAAWPALAGDRFAGRTRALRAAFEGYTDAAEAPEDRLAAMLAHLTEVTPDDAVFCNGAGNYAGWVHRYLRFRAPGSQLAPTSGSMGYGLPAALAATQVTPEREVYALAGDGCFMMTCQELATAVHHNMTLTVIVIDNGKYGTIRAHQERHYPARVSGTALTNPDFCAFARSFGIEAARAETVAEFENALAAARARGGVNLIEVVQDQSFIAPGRRLG